VKYGLAKANGISPFNCGLELWSVGPIHFPWEMLMSIVTQKVQRRKIKAMKEQLSELGARAPVHAVMQCDRGEGWK